MRRLFVLSFCLVALAEVQAARRPRYGGSLRIETRAAVASLDPHDLGADSLEASAKEKILNQVFETLVRLDEDGEPRPLLATSWSHEPAHKRWVFTTRQSVILHNGATWQPPLIAVDDKLPIHAILCNLAKVQNAIVVRTPDGNLLGTGPFRIAKWEPKQNLTLEAHDQYWGGRPYLDRVNIRMGRPQREQSLDFETARADVVEAQPQDIRRIQQRGGKVAMSQPVELLALVLDWRKQEMERYREALALCIDRAAIYNVVFQRQGIISGGLLPQWLSGYAFLFPTALDVARARELAGPPRTLSFAYDQQTPLLRALAERIVLNAAEAGIVLRFTPGASADMRLAVFRINSLDARQALADIAAALDRPAAPVDVYETEKALLISRCVVPLFHLPVAYQLNARVHDWSTGRSGMVDRWRLADVWLDE